MPFADERFAIELVHQTTFLELARIGTTPHIPANHVDIFLIFNHVNNRILRIIGKFRAICIFEIADISGKVNRHHLHTQADSEAGDIPLTRIFCHGDLSLDSPHAKATRDEDAVDILEVIFELTLGCGAF